MARAGVTLEAARSRDLSTEMAGLVLAGLTALGFFVVPFGFVLAALVMGTVGAATFWRPSVGLAGLVVTIPVQASVTIGIGDRNLTLTKLALAGLVAGWIVGLLVAGHAPKVTSIGLALALYVGALTGSIWNAIDRSAWAGETYRWLTALIVYVIASNELRSKWDLDVVLAATGLSIVASFVAAVAQVATHAGPPSFTVNGVTRAFGAFGEPNPFAAYFEIAGLPMLAIAAAIVLGSRSGSWLRRSGLIAIPAGLSMIGVYLTHSRGGAIGAAAGLLAVAVLADRRTRNVVLGTAGIAALALILSGQIELLIGRLDALGHGWNSYVQVTTANFSVEERIAHWGAAFRMWMAHPVIGIGAGNFDQNYREFTPVWRFRIPRGHAHDGYLQAAAQAGTIGLAAYCAVLAAALHRAFVGLKSALTSMERGVAVGAVAVTIAVMAHGIFDYLHVLNLGLQLSMAWAMLETIPRLNGSDAKDGTYV